MFLPALYLLAASFAPTTPARAADDPKTQQAPDARRFLSSKDEPRSAIRVRYEGSFALEAHLAKPHDTVNYETRLTVLADGADRARLDWESWPKGREEERDLDTTLIAGAHVWRRTDAAKPFVEASGKSALLLRARVEALIPWRVLARIRATPESCSAIGSESLSWTENGATRRFTFDAATKRLASVTRAFGHPRLGDVRDEIDYRAWEEREGLALPGKIVMREFDGANVLRSSPGRFELELRSCEHDVALGKELDPPAEAGLEEAVPEAAAGAIAIEELQPGVLAFTAKELDGRALVIEFADHLLAIDAPLSSALGERVVQAIRERFPAKPLRYVLFGHFHPHYTGGLRAFLAAGAKVVAPAGCAAFASEIAARPFTLEPDAWARAAAKPAIESFMGSRVFEDAAQRVEAIDIGKQSGHTDEYVVFYLPRTRTLIQDDIGWSAARDGKLSFGARSRGLRQALEERRLDVQTLWQAWPTASPRPSISFAEFESGTRSKR